MLNLIRSYASKKELEEIEQLILKVCLERGYTEIKEIELDRELFKEFVEIVYPSIILDFCERIDSKSFENMKSMSRDPNVKPIKQLRAKARYIKKMTKALETINVDIILDIYYGALDSTNPTYNESLKHQVKKYDMFSYFTYLVNYRNFILGESGFTNNYKYTTRNEMSIAYDEAEMNERKACEEELNA